MKVSELITRLEQYTGDTELVVFDCGCNEFVPVRDLVGVHTEDDGSGFLQVYYASNPSSLLIT